MSIKHFRFLWANIRFDDISTSEERFEHYRAAVARFLFETFLINCEKVMIPDVYLSLDETLHPNKAGVALPQYNKIQAISEHQQGWNAAYVLHSFFWKTTR